MELRDYPVTKETKTFAKIKILTKYLNFSKRRKDVSNGPKIMKLTSKFKEIRKVFPPYK